MSLNHKQKQKQTNRMTNRNKRRKNPNVTLKDALDKLYEDIESAPSYSAKIEAYLRNNSLHSRHRRIVKKKFPRRRVIARFPFDIFMADLIEYPRLKFQNNGYIFILIVIDCFSRKVWAAPMKRKNANWTADAFESIFSKFDEFPLHIITDRGLGNCSTIFCKINQFFKSSTILK